MTGFDSKRQASKDLLQQALDALMVCTPDNKHGYSMKADALHNLRSALAQPNPWKDAIDNALIWWHIGTIESFPTAKAALDALIDWHVRVALDPEVSSDAQALIDRGAAVAESLSDDELRECFTRTNTAEPLSEGWPGLERFARAIEQAHGIKGGAK